MKFIKHWKLEAFITGLSVLAIPLIYLIFSPFYGQVLFLPLIFGLLPVLLFNRYQLLFLYPLGVSFVYSIFLLIWSKSWPIDFSLVSLAFGTILLPTFIGYLITFLHIKVGKADQKWILAIYCLFSIVIAILATIEYSSSIDKSLTFYLCRFLFTPLVFIGTQALISLLYPSNRFSPLILTLIFILFHGFTNGNYFSPLSILNLVLTYITMYGVVTKIKKQKFF